MTNPQEIKMTAKKIAECIVYSEQCDTGTVAHIGDTMTNEQIGELVR